nr:hypothetical protein GCM10020093_082300 [Planobispora longispora]
MARHPVDALLESEQRGWWEDHADVLLGSYAAYIGLEAGAQSVFTWQSLVIPGLLQTPAYAKATIGPPAPTPFKNLLPGKVAKLAQVRMRRQRLLDEEPHLNVTAVIDESAFFRRFGAEEVMREQLRHLTAVAARPNVEIRVLPLDVDHGAMPHSFVLLRFPEREGLGRLHGDIVYLENAMDSTFVEDEESTFAFGWLFQQMLEKALSPRSRRS